MAVLHALGLGPGDPELVTLKALRLLRNAAAIAYPAPEHGPSFARAIVAQWLDGAQRELPIRFPMRPGPPPAVVYDRAAAALAAELDRGAPVAFLCQGDPLLYGTFIELLDRLAPHYPVEVVPGVSSVTACAAATLIPLAARDTTLSVIPATLPDAELTRRLAAAEAAAVIKLGRHFAKVRRVLESLDRVDGAIYVERASLPNERVLPLAAVDPETVPYFSMALVPPGRAGAARP